MSVPAREVRVPAHGPTPTVAPRREPSRAPTPRPAVRPRSRRRPAFHPGFLFFSTALLTTLVTGVVVLNVLLAQQAFQVRTLRSSLADLRTQGVASTERVAALSAPERVQGWAISHGMVTPPDVFVLRVSGTGGGGRP